MLKNLKNQINNNEIEKAEYIKQMYTNCHSMLFKYSEFIKDTDISNIEISDDNIIFTTRKDSIKLIGSKNDYRDIPIEILNFTEYEKEDSSMMLNFINDNDYIFDIGGNMGWYTILFSKKRKNLTINTFEPIPKTYHNLVANIRINGTNASVHNIGLSEKKEKLTFYYYEECSGNASTTLMDESKNNVKIKCNVNTIDNFIIENNIEKLDFIKCDVEGAELLTFKGGVTTLEKFKPIVFTEMLRKWSKKFNYHPNETLELFKSFGYRCFYTYQNSIIEFFNMTDETEQTNFFFLHKEKHINLISKFCK